MPGVTELDEVERDVVFVGRRVHGGDVAGDAPHHAVIDAGVGFPGHRFARQLQQDAAIPGA